MVLKGVNERRTANKADGIKASKEKVKNKAHKTKGTLCL